MGHYREQLASFDLHTLPDLDTALFAALELCAEEVLPSLDHVPRFRILVVGSGNANAVGRLLFEGADVFSADEGTFEAVLDTHREDIDAVVLISASGGKHAVQCARVLAERGLPLWLLTNNPAAPAAQYVETSRVIVFPKNREPYTYNTSTYFSMLCARHVVDAAALTERVHAQTAGCAARDLSQFDAFYFIVPPSMEPVRDMLLTKFDELFGSVVSARITTYEQAKHAKTVVPSAKECFVSFGTENEVFGDAAHRVHIPMQRERDAIELAALGYACIGHIQRQHPPHFKEHIARYTQEASLMFGQTIKPIVE